MDIKVYENPNATDCIRCLKCRDSCPTETWLHGLTISHPTSNLDLGLDNILPKVHAFISTLPSSSMSRMVKG